MENDALRAVYEKYQRGLFLYLYSLCKNRSLAEDLVQETFLKALLSLPGGHPNLKAWLYLVARNLYFNLCRSEKRLTTLDDVEADLRTDQTPLDDLLLTERSRVLYKALSELNEQKREVLQMQYFGGLSQKEIASVLHLTPENVRVLAWRGKKELKSRLEDKGYDLP